MVHGSPHRQDVHQEGSTENKPTSHTSRVRFLKTQVKTQGQGHKTQVLTRTTDYK